MTNLKLLSKIFVFYLLAIEDNKTCTVNLMGYVIFCLLFIQNKIILLVSLLLPAFNNILGNVHLIDILILLVVSQYNFFGIYHGFLYYHYKMWIILLYGLCIMRQDRKIPVFYVAYMAMLLY